MQLWHYTTLPAFDAILRDEQIRPFSKHHGLDLFGRLEEYVDPQERPIVWASANQHWESSWSTVVDGIGRTRRVGMAEYAEVCGGLVRIGIDPADAPLDWDALKRTSGMCPKLARALERPGVCAHDWYYGTFDPIPQSRWLGVQAYSITAGAWIPIEYVERG
jgi:hypothetical protein